MEHENIYIKHDSGMDTGKVLRIIDEAIVNGRIHCTGVEMADGEPYWVKDCGEYEIVLSMPFENERTLVFDVDGRGAMQIEVRRKRT